MQEGDFWLCLMFRLCGELQGMPEKWQRRYWCDGFSPETYDLNRRPPMISGTVSMVEGKGPHSQWNFLLLLPQRYKSRNAIEWASLLPPHNVTCWLAMDELRKLMEIEPAGAIPDHVALSTRSE